MWKVVISDNEEEARRGIHNLIDWKSLHCEIVAEAANGPGLLERIEKKRPDLVISDIELDGKNGFEVIQEIKDRVPKFIFMSSYEEFSYVREAFRYGAVDYLLKPVAGTDLEHSVRKAVKLLNDQNVAGFFEIPAGDMQHMFWKVNDGSECVNQELYEYFENLNINLAEKEMTGVTFTILPNRTGADIPFEKAEFVRFDVYNRIQGMLRNQRNGFVIKKESDYLNVILVAPASEKTDLVSKYILPVKKKIEETCLVHLCVGIGFPTNRLEMMKQTYKAAKFCCEMYYFCEHDIVEYTKINKEYGVSLDNFNEAAEDVLQAMLLRDDSVMEKISKALDMIESIHYGNRYAAENRCLIFAGSLAEKLYSYHLLEGDFTTRQDIVQAGIQRQTTWADLKAHLLDYYENELIPEISENIKKRDPAEIAVVKKYIQENYMNEISLKQLANVACVSETYLSSLFKKTTGENYKDYLVKIRMKEAIRLLLQTDMKTYAIAYEVGYNNTKRFVETFKSIYGMTPVEYRRKHQKDS